MSFFIVWITFANLLMLGVNVWLYRSMKKPIDGLIEGLKRQDGIDAEILALLKGKYDNPR